jgi:type II secretory pathway component GspD/PulD (secretin)
MAGVAVFGSVLWLQAQDPKTDTEKSAPVPAAEPADEPAKKSDGPTPPAPPQDPPAAPPRREPIDPDAREIQFSFATQPWDGVLQWIAEVAGLSLQMDVKPSGTFNYINDPRKYTLGGALDVLNAQLGPKGFTLIRKGNYLKVVALEEGIPADLVPRITPNELDSRGESEFVSLIFPVKNVLAKVAAEEVKNLVGKYGKVVPLDSVNRLMITDTAGNVRLMRDLLDQIDGEESALQSKTRIFQLKYTVASKVEMMLRDVLGVAPRSASGSQSGSRSSGDPREDWRNRMREAMERGGPMAMFGDFMSGGGTRPPGGGGEEERRDRGGDSRRGDQQQQQQQQQVYLAVDDRLNQILVKSDAATLALVEEIISKVDVPREGEDPFKPREPQTPTVRVYRLSDGDSQSLVTALQAIFQNTPGVRFSADQTNNAVVAVATPDDQKAIAELVRDFEDDERDSIVMPLSVLEAAAVTDLLTNVYASTQRDWRGNPVPRAGGPRVVADVGRNQIMVRGSKKQIDDIRGMLGSLGETQLTAASTSDRVRVVPLTSTDQRSLSEALQKIWPTVRPNNPIRVIEPGKRPAANGADPTAAPEGPPPRDETYRPNTPSTPRRPVAPPSNQSAPPATESGRTRRDVDSPVRLASFVTKDSQQEPPADQDAKSAPATQPEAAEGAPVVVAFGPGNVVIASDDPDALNAFMNLINSLTRGGTAGGSDYTVYYLKAADATAITTTLNDLLGLSTVSSSFSFFGPQRQQPTTSLKIVPDVRTNSLIIVGSTTEVARVTQLLEVLDRPDAPQSGAVSQPRIIPVRFGIASQISQVIRDVYANQLTSAAGGSRGFTVGFGGFGSGGPNASNNPAGARGTLSIGVDESSNSLVVSCSERMFDEVRQLVELLDTAANDTQRTVKIVTVRNAAPTAVQDALNGLMGVQTTSSRSSDSRSSSRGSSGFPGGGLPFGGFPGGGFPGGGFPGGFPGGGFDRGGDRGGDRDRGSDGDRFRRDMFDRMFRGGDRGRD